MVRAKVSIEDLRVARDDLRDTALVLPYASRAGAFTRVAAFLEAEIERRERDADISTAHDRQRDIEAEGQRAAVAFGKEWRRRHD